MARDFMRAEAIPGASVAWGFIGEDPSTTALGFADLAAGAPMTTEHRFRLASLSKPITAAAVMELVAERRLGLDERLGEIIPEVDAATDLRHRQITIRDLLRHTGGWDRTATFDPMVDADQVERELGISAGDDCAPVARAMLARPLDYDPGTAQIYSNLGYCWLAMAIEARSGVSYAQYAKAEVLDPRGLPTLHLGEGDTPPNALVVHYEGGRDGHRAVPRDAASEAMLLRFGPFGGWTGTAADYFRFTTRELPENTAERPDFVPSDEPGYGLGWRVWPGEHGPTLAHAGFLPGIFTVVVRRPDGFVAVMLFNASPRNDMAAYERLVAGIRDAASRP